MIIMYVDLTMPQFFLKNVDPQKRSKYTFGCVRPKTRKQIFCFLKPNGNRNWNKIYLPSI